VCGEQRRDDRCTTLLPGLYATAVTLHNIGCQDARIHKLFIPVVIGEEQLGREPRVAEPRAKDEIALPPGMVTMDDCCRINELLFGNPNAGQHVFGVLEIRSDVELVVEATYTAATRSGIASIDVRRIPPKRC
jgi:hypothetical protein